MVECFQHHLAASTLSSAPRVISSSSLSNIGVRKDRRHNLRKLTFGTPKGSQPCAIRCCLPDRHIDTPLRTKTLKRTKSPSVCICQCSLVRRLLSTIHFSAHRYSGFDQDCQTHTHDHTHAETNFIMAANRKVSHQQKANSMFESSGRNVGSLLAM